MGVESHACVGTEEGGVCEAVDVESAAMLQSSKFGLTASSIDANKPQDSYCADGYTLQVGKILSNWGSCSGTRGAGYCILSPEEARAFCDAESECAGVSETSNAGWLATFPGMQSLGRLVLNSNAEWSSCVKEAVLGHRPQYGYCADGYTLQVGKILSTWGSCSGTRGAGYCILSPEEARAFCDAESECAGVSETSNAGWLATFPGMQSPGRLVLNSNAEWSSCVKGTNAPSPNPTPRPSEAPPTSPPTAPPTTPPTAPPTAPPTGPCKKKV